MTHSYTFNLSSFYIDKTPVTNEAFKRFLDESGYKPAVARNFLRDWRDGRPRAGWERKPVTWVTVDDAKSYCAFVGKRLPNEWEWQYAAQGTDDRPYPWGGFFDSACVPTPVTSRSIPNGPDSVDAHQSCGSPFGVLDLVGNTWEMTNVFADAHTRAIALKGGSLYFPQGSKWYFPNVQKVNEHGKFLMSGDALNRAATIGFRCVAEA